MTDRSIMGIPVNPCINGITKAQAAKINEIDGIKADIIEIESQLGNSGKEWLELPFSNYASFQPYINKISDGTKLKYDLMFQLFENNKIIFTTFAAKNTLLTSEFSSFIGASYAGTTTKSIIYKTFRIKSVIESTGSTITPYSKLGIDIDGTSITEVSTSVTPINRSYFKIYVFAADLENL